MNKLVTASLTTCLILCCTKIQATELNIYGQGYLSVDNINDGSQTSLAFIPPVALLV